MRQLNVFGLLVAVLCTACSSTQPQAPSAPGGVERTLASRPAAATATVLPLDNEGPVTPIMAELQLSGERYAALGDPAAPITMVEVSDFG